MDLKGISPIISIVLLLMITISMIGFAWIWFMRIGANLQNSTDTNINNTQTNIMKKIIIESAVTMGGNSIIVIRNVGSMNVSSSEIVLFMDGQTQTCPGLSTIAPQNVVTCMLSGTTCTGMKVKVTSPGGFDEVVCS